MLAIVVGFAFGVVVYLLALWIARQFRPLYQLVTAPETTLWLRVLLVGLIIVVSGMWLGVFFIVVHVSPPLTGAFDHHGFWDLFWLAFHGSRFPSGFVGFVLGLLTTAWGRYATKPFATNVGVLGIV
jgi:hypothetical protein